MNSHAVAHPIHWLLIWVWPLMFSICSRLSFEFPGDEYALYFISGIAGTWGLVLAPSFDIHAPWVPWLAIGCGALVFAGLGHVADRLRARRVVWLMTFLVFTLIFFIWPFFSHASIERALAKNGSVWAYLLAALNLGLTFSALSALITAGLANVRRRWRAARPAVHSS